MISSFMKYFKQLIAIQVLLFFPDMMSLASMSSLRGKTMKDDDLDNTRLGLLGEHRNLDDADGDNVSTIDHKKRTSHAKTDSQFREIVDGKSSTNVFFHESK